METLTTAPEIGAQPARPVRLEKLARIMATAYDALTRCRSDSANASQAAWESRWESVIERAAEMLPRGGGFDVYPTLDTDSDYRGRLVFRGSYHMMNDAGMYDGWRDYAVTVKPCLVHGFTVAVRGGGRDLGDYIAESFHAALSAEYDPAEFHEDNANARYARLEAAAASRRAADREREAAAVILQNEIDSAVADLAAESAPGTDRTAILRAVLATAQAWRHNPERWRAEAKAALPAWLATAAEESARGQ